VETPGAVVATVRSVLMFAFFNIGAQEIIVLFLLGLAAAGVGAVVIYFASSNKSKDE
jgi:hypothetical protein